MTRRGQGARAAILAWALLFAVAAVAGGAGGRSGGAPPPLAIVDARVVDGSGRPPVTATVIVRDGRISAVGPRLPIPDGARVIPADGMTLVAGFFDLHEHVPYAAVRGFRGDWIKNLYACLAAGVTTVVDFGRDPESFGEVRRVLAAGRLPTPRLLLAARFAVPAGHGAEIGRDWFTSLAVTPEQAEAAFARVSAHRPDALKLFTDGWRYGAAANMADMPRGTVLRLSELARSAGIPTLSHTVTLQKAKEAVGAGVDVLAHAVSDQPVDGQLIELMLANDACYAPTMAVYEPAPPDFRPAWTETLLEPSVRRRIPELQPDFAPRAPAERTLTRWKNILSNTKALHDAGVKVALGTDAGVVGTYHGWAVLRELELLVEAGLTPIEALQAATRTSADCLGVLADRGVIAPGKRADLTLIEGAPDQRIEDVWNIRKVFLDGREAPRQELFDAIQTEGPLVAEIRPAQAEIDRFESDDGRSAGGALWRADFESGRMSTSVAHSRVWRAPGDHCITALVKFAASDEPFARLSLPLSPGAVAAVDASDFEGVEFEARGDGPVRLVIETPDVRDGDDFGVEFEAGPEWTRFRFPFDSLRRASGDGTAIPPGRLLSVGFRMTGPGGSQRFLELDNLRFWRPPG